MSKEGNHTSVNCDSANARMQTDIHTLNATSTTHLHSNTVAATIYSTITCSHF